MLTINRLVWKTRWASGATCYATWTRNWPTSRAVSTGTVPVAKLPWRHSTRPTLRLLLSPNSRPHLPHPSTSRSAPWRPPSHPKPFAIDPTQQRRHPYHNPLPAPTLSKETIRQCKNKSKPTKQCKSTQLHQRRVSMKPHARHVTTM